MFLAFTETAPVGNLSEKVAKRRRGGGVWWNDWRGAMSVCTASLFLHGVILLIVSLVPAADPPWKKKAVAVVTRLEPEEEIVLTEAPVEMPELEEVEVDEPDVSVEASEERVDLEELAEVDDEVPEEEFDVADEFEWSMGMEEKTEMPEGFGLAELALNNISGSDGLPTAYKGRASKKEQKKMLQSHGGAPEVLDAVGLALRWLAAHQLPDGSWPLIKGEVSKKGEGNVKEAKKPAGKIVKKAESEEEAQKKMSEGKSSREIRASITGTALLAFLGAGHSETMGQYKGTVRKGINYLNQYLLDNPGHLLGKTYGASIVLMALAEASIFSSSPLTTKNANVLAKKLRDVYDGEGWGYKGGGDDFSVSGWVALGLKSGRQADLKALRNEEVEALFDKYGVWVNKMTNPETGEGMYRPGKKGSRAMSWVGMFQKQFLGFPKEDPFLLKAGEVSVKDVPKVFSSIGKGMDEYEIYYGTLAAFQQQGPFWKAWNPAMQNSLLSLQREGPVEKLGGSWDPSSKHVGKDGGRVMTTAIYTLCLEVYYRYALMQ